MQLQLGVDESYTLFVAKNDGQSIIGEVTIEVNFVFDSFWCYAFLVSVLLMIIYGDPNEYVVVLII